MTRKQDLISEIQDIVGEPLTTVEKARLKDLTIAQLTSLKDYMHRARGVFAQAKLAKDKMLEPPRCVAVYKGDGKRCVKEQGHSGLHQDELGDTWASGQYDPTLDPPKDIKEPLRRRDVADPCRKSDRCTRPNNHPGCHTGFDGEDFILPDEVQPRVETYDDHKVEWDGPDERTADAIHEVTMRKDPTSWNAVSQHRTCGASYERDVPFSDGRGSMSSTHYCQLEEGHAGEHGSK